MGKISKEQKLHLEGMAFALKIAKEHGIDGLEKEVEFRGADNVPLNVSRYELTVIARERSKKELMVVATALAETVSQDMKLPPSVVMEFLKKFNNKVDVFRYDNEALEKAQIRLTGMQGMNETIRKFNEED